MTEQSVEWPQRTRHIVIGSTLDLNVDKANGFEQALERPAREDSQMPDHLVSRPTIDASQAHLGEQGLDAACQEHPVVPSGKVGGGQEQCPTRAQHSPSFIQRAVGVHEVFDEFAHDDDVDARVGKRQPTLVREARATGTVRACACLSAAIDQSIPMMPTEARGVDSQTAMATWVHMPSPQPMSTATNGRPVAEAIWASMAACRSARP